MSEANGNKNGDAELSLDSGASEAIPNEEYVRWAYRLLLGREPENLAAIRDNPFKHDRRLLLRAIFGSDEFQNQYDEIFDTSGRHPYKSWNSEAIAFIHLPKTGGSTLYDLLSGCFPPDRICPQHFDALHLYSPAELTRYDLYQGHIDYFSLRFIPRRRVRCLSIFRDPVRRLISWYRYSKSHPPSDEFSDDINIKLANELSAEEYFEHEIITSSTYNNNAYLFFFSSLHDRKTLDALDNDAMHSAARTAEDCPMVEEVLADNDLVGRALAQAAHRILKLDAIGLTERFQDSVETIFETLGFPVPENIASVRVTDELSNSDVRFSRVPPVPMTPRLARALDRLTKYDRILYDLARREFDRRRASALLLAPTRLDRPRPAANRATSSERGEAASISE